MKWYNMEGLKTYRKRSFHVVLLTLPIVMTSLTVPFKCSHVSSKLTCFGFSDMVDLILSYRLALLMVEIEIKMTRDSIVAISKCWGMTLCNGFD